MARQQVSSGTIWEERYGYSRAVRVGNWVAVAGTTASDENSQIVGEGDPHAQAVYIFRKIERALEPLGAGLKDVIRVRMFVVEEAYWEPTARAMGEFFRDIRPASTLVVVKGLINPKMLVEIEVDAVLEG
jgi:enamine deaminase RidA (YjgF/YER057c/UK114 family)